MRLLKPEDIQQIGGGDIPLLVLVDNLRGLFAWRIKSHTRGYYSHAMWMIEPGQCASQELWYRRVAIMRLVDGAHRLKFWHNPTWDWQSRVRLVTAAERKLTRPRWRTLYDWLGILGHRLGLRRLQIPWWDYCSEDAGELLRIVEPSFDVKHPTPAEINAWCKANHQMMVFGLYDPDLVLKTRNRRR